MIRKKNGEQKIGIVRWKKIVLIAIAVLFLIRIGYIAIRGEVDKAYYVSHSYDLSQAMPVPCSDISETFVSEHDRLDSLELVFTGIASDKAGAITVCIFLEDELMYQTDVSLVNINNSEWEKIFVNAPLRSGDVYKITINANEVCTQIPNVLLVHTGYASEILESFSGNEKLEGNVAVNYGYLQFPGRADRLVIISLWMILYAFIFFIIKQIEVMIDYGKKAKKRLLCNVKEEALLYFTEIIFCYILLNCGGIDFQEMTKVIFYIISFIAVTNHTKKKVFIDSMTDARWKKVLLSIVYFYASFSLMGQRILIYPLTSKVTFHGLFVLICGTLWFVPVVNSILYYLEIIVKSAFGKKSNLKTWQFIAVHAFILLLPAAYNLFANNPGISSPDTQASMITNAQHLYGMYDWHPAFYCMILRAIEEVWNSTYAVIAVQYFFWAYVMIELFLYLRWKGLSDAIIAGTSVFCGLNASNFIHINTIWKDIPYTLSLLWIFVLMTKLSMNFDHYKHKWYIYLETIVALVGVFFYRKNGVVSFAVITIVLLIFLRNNKRLIAALFTSLFLIGIVKGPIYTHYQVEDPGVSGMYHGLGQDILGVYYAGGEVSESTLQMINMMTSYNNAEYAYTPTWSNQSYDVQVKPAVFIRNYMDTFFKNPVTMIRAMIAREDAVWDIYAGQDTRLSCVNYIGTQDGHKEWNHYYDKRIYRILYTWMSAATAYTADTQWIAAIEWRCGLLCLLGLICTAWLVIRYGKGKHLVMIAPIGAHILGLFLSTGWSDFRYFWPLNLLNTSLFLLTIILIREKEYMKS